MRSLAKREKVIGQIAPVDIDNGQFPLHLGKEAHADAVAAEHAGKIIAGEGIPIQRRKCK